MLVNLLCHQVYMIKLFNLYSQNWLYTSSVLTVCYYHFMYAFQSESTLYGYLNVKELLARNRRDIWSLSDSNGIWIYNHLVRKQTLNHLVKWLSVRLRTKWLWLRIPLLSLKQCFIFGFFCFICLFSIHSLNFCLLFLQNIWISTFWNSFHLNWVLLLIREIKSFI